MYNIAKRVVCCACCACMLLLISLPVWGQLRCKLDHYTTEDGLSHNAVMCMIKDHDGFMWFGTWDGINRFDGHNFVFYKSKPGDTSSLRNNRIDEIVEDKTGYLWLRAYDNQVYRFDKNTEQFMAVSELLSGPSHEKYIFDDVLSTSSGKAIWLRTRRQGIFCITNPGAPHITYSHYAHGFSKGFNLPSNHINFVYEDSEHAVWIGTSSGLSCLKRNKAGKYINIELGSLLSHAANINCIAECDNKIWLGTNDGRILVYQKNAATLYSQHISDFGINNICVSRQQPVVYVSTSGSEVVSVNKTNPANIVVNKAGRGPLFSMYEDRTGVLWIEPDKHGIIRFDPIAHTFNQYTHKKDASYENPAKYYKVFEDKNGLVWMSMKGEGFGYYDTAADAVKYFYDERGSDNYRFSNLVIATYLDPAGVLWVSSDDRGLNKVVFQGTDFNQQLLVNHTYSRSDNEIRGICADRNNRLWLASKSGQLYVYDKGKRVPVTFTNMPADGFGVIYNIIQDKTGAMWMGTKGNGLFRVVPVNSGQPIYKVDHYLNDKSDPYSLSSNVIYSLMQDSRGRIWAGSFEEGINLVQQQGDHVRFLNTRNSFKNYPQDVFRKIRHMEEDAAGRIWIATTNGVLIFNPNEGNASNYRFVGFSKIAGDKTSLGKNDVQFIYRDSKNTMWLSTSGGGLNKAIGDDPFKSLKFKVYTTDDGLPSDYVLSSIEDNSGNLWLATENGLSRFNPRNEQFRNYDSYDGLPQTGLSESTGLKLADGRLVFGCIAGYILFDPASIGYHQIAGKIAFTNLQVNNTDVVVGGAGSPLKNSLNNTHHIILKYNQNILGIDYSLLDFRSGNKQSYSYRLNGFDKVWHDNKGQRRATYTNLPPGDYIFEVKIQGNDLYSNTPYKSLAITILPPPWRTWWAYLLYVIFTAVLIESVRRTSFTMLKLRHNIEVEKKLANLKLSFFTNISHELRTPLTLILNPIEEIYKKEELSAQGADHINVVRKNAKRMVRFINQLLDLRKVQSGRATLRISEVEMGSFVKKISEYFTDVAWEKQINLEIVADKSELLSWIDVEKMDIVIYNLLANAFKFTPAGKSIRIAIKEQDNAQGLAIEIADQGQGVPENKLSDIFELYYEGEHTEGKHLKGTGIGLALSKELVELHEGKIFARNNADGGLTVTVMLKQGKDHLQYYEVTFVDLPEIPHEFEETVEELLSDSITTPPCRHSEDTPLVLLVEDNSDLRTFLNTQLSELYRVELAENGEEGLQKAMNLLPDLILSDVMMPVMDGIQMMDRLKNDILTSHIPIILLSARFSIEHQIEGLKYGADYYITKPFHNELLMASVETLIKQRKKIFDNFLNQKRTIALSPGEIVITSQDEIFLKKVIKIVEDRMPDPDFNIDAVAESINMGRSAFYKKFKSLTNLAPVEFVREMRLKRAIQFLDAGETNIAEIAYHIGFNNAKYFSTCFKDQYHLSPTEYLKSKAIKV